MNLNLNKFIQHGMCHAERAFPSQTTYNMYMNTGINMGQPRQCLRMQTVKGQNTSTVALSLTLNDSELTILGGSEFQMNGELTKNEYLKELIHE